MDCPEGRPIHAVDQGRVVEIPEIGGLHHHYERVAAWRPTCSFGQGPWSGLLHAIESMLRKSLQVDGLIRPMIVRVSGKTAAYTSA